MNMTMKMTILDEKTTMDTRGRGVGVKFFLFVLYPLMNPTVLLQYYNATTYHISIWTPNSSLPQNFVELLKSRNLEPSKSVGLLERGIYH